MSPNGPPFIDHATGELDTAQIHAEAVPLAKVVGVFIAIPLGVFTLVTIGAGPTTIGPVLVVLLQLVLAVGGGLVLMYVIARGIQLGTDGTASRGHGDANR